MSYLYQWISDLASISSIVGVGITILVLIEAKKIRESFLLKARLPEIIKDLEKISVNLVESVKNWDDSKTIRLKEVARCKSILTDNKIKVPKNIQTNIDNVMEKINKRQLSDLSSDDIFEVYGELQVVIESFKQTRQNLQWSES